MYSSHHNKNTQNLYHDKDRYNRYHDDNYSSNEEGEIDSKGVETKYIDDKFNELNETIKNQGNILAMMNMFLYQQHQSFNNNSLLDDIKVILDNSVNSVKSLNSYIDEYSFKIRQLDEQSVRNDRVNSEYQAKLMKLDEQILLNNKIQSEYQQFIDELTNINNRNLILNNKLVTSENELIKFNVQNLDLINENKNLKLQLSIMNKDLTENSTQTEKVEVKVETEEVDEVEIVGSSIQSESVEDINLEVENLEIIVNLDNTESKEETSSPNTILGESRDVNIIKNPSQSNKKRNKKGRRK